MNPALETMVGSGKKPILFVHVGKCAGEAAINMLRGALDDRFVLFELHVQGADKMLREIVEHHAQEFIYLISKRHPVDRFVSAYNWDKHNLYLRNQIRDPQSREFFQRFPTVQDLACGLGSQDPDVAAEAGLFAKFAHMGMGQSYYTPVEILNAMPGNLLHVYETSSFERDLGDFVERILGERVACRVPEAGEKSNYQGQYENGEALFPTALTADARKNLERLLTEDLRAYNWLGAFQKKAETSAHG